MRIRRTRPRRRTSKGGVKDRIAKLESAIEEPHYIIWSDSGIGGGTAPLLKGFTGPLFNSAPKVLMVNGYISRGDTVQGRTADRVHPTKLIVKMAINAGTSIVDESWIHVELIQVKTMNGTPPTVGDMFTCMYGTPTPNPTQVMMNVNQRDYAKYFRLLERKVIKFSGQSLSATEQKMVTFTHYFPRSFQTSYKLGAAGTPSDVDTNGIYLAIYTGSTVTGATSINFFTEAILYFRG